MAATDVRPKITLACEECKNRNYITRKNRRNDPDRLELKKYCPQRAQAHAAPRDPLTRSAAEREGGSMALDRELVGRSYPPSAVYEVGREKIPEFADRDRRRRPGLPGRRGRPRAPATPT